MKGLFGLFVGNNFPLGVALVCYYFLGHLTKHGLFHIKIMGPLGSIQVSFPYFLLTRFAILDRDGNEIFQIIFRWAIEPGC